MSADMLSLSMDRVCILRKTNAHAYQDMNISPEVRGTRCGIEVYDLCANRYLDKLQTP